MRDNERNKWEGTSYTCTAASLKANVKYMCFTWEGNFWLHRHASLPFVCDPVYYADPRYTIDFHPTFCPLQTVSLCSAFSSFYFCSFSRLYITEEVTPCAQYHGYLHAFLQILLPIYSTCSEFHLLVSSREYFFFYKFAPLIATVYRLDCALTENCFFLQAILISSSYVLHLYVSGSFLDSEIFVTGLDPCPLQVS